ncbi:hypothetical protein AVDCRST_MAG92-5253 [uncultured Coleofasciculus sp.]|uniref:Uncharacterized protein n=1 Tax=uncultured Coleofasciculus sp. TaxID=1267456 RepID=A0A6J4KDQ8_9CYAN|nr:hypothetical protein AVDCRST_MAG92-5253 [uncultured Coleofasciculus sp.]
MSELNQAPKILQTRGDFELMFPLVWGARGAFQDSRRRSNIQER